MYRDAALPLALTQPPSMPNHLDTNPAVAAYASDVAAVVEDCNLAVVANACGLAIVANAGGAAAGYANPTEQDRNTRPLKQLKMVAKQLTTPDEVMEDWDELLLVTSQVKSAPGAALKKGTGNADNSPLVVPVLKHPPALLPDTSLLGLSQNVVHISSYKLPALPTAARDFSTVSIRPNTNALNKLISFLQLDSTKQ